MGNDKSNRLKSFSKRIGLASLAILWCLAERGSAVLIEMLAGRRESLGKSLKRIDKLKDVDDYYEILKNLDKHTARTLIWRLEKKGLVQKSPNGHDLTKTGHWFYQNLNVTKTWDGKLRIVMFDIPETRKKQRDFVRSGLQKQEYIPLQKSVFIGKYPPDEDFLEQLIERDLYQYLRIILVGDIDDESILENFV